MKRNLAPVIGALLLAVMGTACKKTTCTAKDVRPREIGDFRRALDAENALRLKRYEHALRRASNRDVLAWDMPEVPRGLPYFNGDARRMVGYYKVTELARRNDEGRCTLVQGAKPFRDEARATRVMSWNTLTFNAVTAATELRLESLNKHIAWLLAGNVLPKPFLDGADQGELSGKVREVLMQPDMLNVWARHYMPYINHMVVHPDQRVIAGELLLQAFLAAEYSLSSETRHQCRRPSTTLGSAYACLFRNVHGRKALYTHLSVIAQLMAEIENPQAKELAKRAKHMLIVADYEIFDKPWHMSQLGKIAEGTYVPGDIQREGFGMMGVDLGGVWFVPTGADLDAKAKRAVSACLSGEVVCTSIMSGGVEFSQMKRGRHATDRWQACADAVTRAGGKVIREGRGLTILATAELGAPGTRLHCSIGPGLAPVVRDMNAPGNVYEDE